MSRNPSETPVADDLSRQIAALSPDQRAAAGQQAEILAAVTQGLATRPYAERRAILTHMAPHLAARGVSPEVAAAFDPSDENLVDAFHQAVNLRAMLTSAPPASPQATLAPSGG
jgi:hypothetical protein